MPTLQFTMPGHLKFGPGCRREVPAAILRIVPQNPRPLLVADPSLVKAGIVAEFLEILAASGIEPAVFDGIEPDPRIAIAELCAEAARDARANLVIGLGGGSTLDIAKVAAILATREGGASELLGIDKIPARGLPTILLPTTAGTGSEVTPIAVLSDTDAHLKKGIVSPHLVPDLAVVDPELMLGVPPKVTAYTGMDALTHAIEAFTNRNAQPFVDVLALRAIELTGRHLRRAVWCGWELAPRSEMAMASLLGGMCLGPVNTAAVHALAYPLGGTFNVPHGLANTVLLPHVLAFNLPSDLPKFARIAVALGENTEGLSEREAAELAVDAVSRLASDIAIDLRLRDLDIPEDAIPGMAKSAMDVTRLLNNNPRPLTEADAAAIYRAAW